MMNTSAQSLIHLDGVTKVFFTDEVETHALAGIHLEIKSGEYIAIAGPSGCGKSTLLSILGLLDSPTEGRYVLNGKEVADLPLSERARVRNREIGFIFQSFNLIGDLNVYENVELPLTYRGMKSTERKERVMAALEKVGMAHRAKHLPSQLSGGQQQRVAVARAVAGSPSILLADEPTGNLDSKNGEAVMELPPRAAPRRRDDLHGHARPALRAARRPLDPSLRRPRRGGGRPEEPHRRKRARRERLRHRSLELPASGASFQLRRFRLPGVYLEGQFYHHAD
jgi:putative ABC transport system ATP-binding protein